MLIFVGESQRMRIQGILIGLLCREGVLFEEVEGFGFIMLDDVPYCQLFNKPIVLVLF